MDYAVTQGLGHGLGLGVDLQLLIDVTHVKRDSVYAHPHFDARGLVIVAIHQQLQEAGFVRREAIDRKSTRLNSSHLVSSYGVFCLKKKIHSSSTSKLRRASVIMASCSAPTVPHAAACLPDHSARLRPPGRTRHARVFFFFLIIGRPRASPFFPHGPLSQ